MEEKIYIFCILKLLQMSIFLQLANHQEYVRLQSKSYHEKMTAKNKHLSITVLCSFFLPPVTIIKSLLFFQFSHCNLKYFNQEKAPPRKEYNMFCKTNSAFPFNTIHIQNIIFTFRNILYILFPYSDHFPILFLRYPGQFQRVTFFNI